MTSGYGAIFVVWVLKLIKCKDYKTKCPKAKKAGGCKSSAATHSAGRRLFLYLLVLSSC